MNRILSIVTAGFLALQVSASPGPATSPIDPDNTFVFIVGVLNWESPALGSFSTRNRKDEELYNLFLGKGVNPANTFFLKDKEATLSNIEEKMKELLGRTNSNSTFIFYYAGHGARAGNGPVSFANYDYGADKGFLVSTVSTMINNNFKGKQVWLLADCCYSGTLMEEARKIGSKGKSVICFTSSSSANISTGNWTFTQTMIDCLDGLARSDRNADGKISLGEVKAELFDAMKYREKQLSGTVFYNTAETTAYNLSALQGESKTTKAEYIYVAQNNKFEPARVISYTGPYVTGELYQYTDKVAITVPVTQTRPIAFAEYAAGMEVQVEWNGKTYPAEIKESKNGFHYIHYTGYDDSWNEWVMYSRIYTSDRKNCNIEWKGQWYPGEMLQQKNGKYFVQYTGFGNDWDEWVEATRIKL